jgi:hypothetical protein
MGLTGPAELVSLAVLGALSGQIVRYADDLLKRYSAFPISGLRFENLLRPSFSSSANDFFGMSVI